jgi:hypothetical protein
MVVDQMASRTTGTSTLYGVKGDVDGMVQDAYPVDAGKQFAWMANSQLNTGGTFDATAASLGLTTQYALGLTPVDNGKSIVGSPFSPDVESHAVPYPQISVSALPEGPAGTIRNLNGFESFMAFNPLGQALGGAADRVSAMANGLWNVVTHPVDTADAIGAHYGNAYAAGTLGDTVLGDVGGVLTGMVKSSPVGLLDAMYHQDQAGAAYRMGGAAVDATLFAGPSLAGPALEAGAVLFGPKLAGMTEAYWAKAGGLSYVTEPSVGALAKGMPTGFGSEALLREHFVKHGGEFTSAGISTAEGYLQIGKDIVANGAEVRYFYDRANEWRTGYVSFMRNSQKTGESLFGFVGTNSDGFITTIHTKPRTELFNLLGDSSQSKLKVFRTDTVGPNPQTGWKWPY